MRLYILFVFSEVGQITHFEIQTGVHCLLQNIYSFLKVIFSQKNLKLFLKCFFSIVLYVLCWLLVAVVKVATGQTPTERDIFVKIEQFTFQTKIAFDMVLLLHTPVFCFSSSQGNLLNVKLLILRFAST